MLMPDPTTLPAVVDPVDLYVGDDTTWPTYRFLESDGITPENLTGYTWKAQWRPTPESDTFVELGIDLAAAATGYLTPYATAAQSAQIAAGGVWDLQSTVGGVVRTWIRGQVKARKDVTRA